jgi:hypothetical protein
MRVADVFLASCVKNRYPDFYASISQICESLGIVIKLFESENPWIRDYFPVQIEFNYLRFGYNPFYHRVKRYREPLPPLQSNSLFKWPLTKSDLPIDGGAVIYDPFKKIFFISSTFYNPELSKILQPFHIKCVQITPDPMDFTRHLDGLYRIINNCVLYSSYLDQLKPKWHLVNKTIFQNLGYHFCPVPDIALDDNSDYFKGTYLNFLIVNEFVLLPRSKPLWARPSDVYALEVKVEVFFLKHFGLIPKWVDCDAPIDDGGAIHCLTWES